MATQEDEFSISSYKGRPELAYASKDRHYNGANSKLPDALANDNDCRLEIKHETVLHRRVVLMAIGGLTNVEIAEITGYGSGYITDILRQPWARQRMISEAKVEGSILRAKLEQEGMKCLDNLISMANNTHLKQEVQLAANIKVIDRWLGKEVQPHTLTDAKPSDLTEAELDQRINERLTAKSN